MTTDSWQGKDEAKTKITNALYGLGMVLISWLLLYTINPDLVSFSKNTFLNPPPPSTETKVQPKAKTQVLNDAVAQKSDKENRDTFTQAGITVSGGSGACTDYMNPHCTSLSGLPKRAIDGLLNLKKSCSSCDVVIVGGTEAGHSSHGVGIATVDLRYNQAVFEALKSIGLRETPFSPGSQSGTFTCEPPGGGNQPITCGPNAGTIHTEF